MPSIKKSAGDVCHDSSAASGPGVALVAAVTLPQRDGSVTVRDVIAAYMLQYAGRDTSRPQRLRFWQLTLGHLTLTDLLDDDALYAALERLAVQRGRYFFGLDSDGRPIYKAKRTTLTPATLNRYQAAISAVFSWAIKKRIAPRGWMNPCHQLERRPEHNEVVRFLTNVECTALLAECRRSAWPRLYLLVMLALTTGGRRGELEALRWRDVDLERAEATIPRSKNGDPKVLPLVPIVVEELRRFQKAPEKLLFASTRRPDIAYNHVPVWQRALKNAGIGNFRFHDLRHSCASYLAQNGATLLEIATVLGHRNLSVTRRYSHLAIEHKTKLIRRVMGELK